MAKRRAGAGRGGSGGMNARGAGTGWSQGKAERFVEGLSNYCNVTRAAAEAGISVSAAYRRRTVDASFRSAWAQAMSIGYAQLEMMMLERALHGVEKIVVRGGESQVMREYCDRTALALLKMHRESVQESEQTVEPTEYAEACERILARLKRLRERGPAVEAKQVETKQAVDPVALIRWALRIGAQA